jgi:hypothetical protein
MALAEREGFELFCASQTFALGEREGGQARKTQTATGCSRPMGSHPTHMHSKSPANGELVESMAEREGFEPSRGLSPP